ncbi:MAG: hypothetical protein QF559_00330 [Candidatus Nitrosopelagicus sp.]|jgi:hypothetical protein|nr:hypothetical protein [Candidatus Nitrosopelagicus sp.]
MGKKAPKWKPSRKELEKILEVDNVHELFLVGQVCVERIFEKILEKKFDIPSEVLEDGQFMWYQKFLILDKSGLLKGNVKKNAGLINSIRSRYAHRLKPDEKAIDSQIRELEYLGASHGNSITKFEKYKICVISTFSALEKILTK